MDRRDDAPDGIELGILFAQCLGSQGVFRVCQDLLDGGFYLVWARGLGLEIDGRARIGYASIGLDLVLHYARQDEWESPGERFLHRAVSSVVDDHVCMLEQFVEGDELGDAHVGWDVEVVDIGKVDQRRDDEDVHVCQSTEGWEDEVCGSGAQRSGRDDHERLLVSDECVPPRWKLDVTEAHSLDSADVFECWWQIAPWVFNIANAKLEEPVWVRIADVSVKRRLTRSSGATHSVKPTLLKLCKLGHFYQAFIRRFIACSTFRTGVSRYACAERQGVNAQTYERHYPEADYSVWPDTWGAKQSRHEPVEYHLMNKDYRSRGILLTSLSHRLLRRVKVVWYICYGEMLLLEDCTVWTWSENLPGFALGGLALLVGLGAMDSLNRDDRRAT